MYGLRRITRTGFTLIELLITISLISILAAVMLPTFSASSEDAKDSALQFNLKELRTQLNLYHLEHRGTWPEVRSENLPQLLKNTNEDGDSGTGSGYPHGPYIAGEEFPVNPVNEKNKVKKITSLPSVVASGGYGWLYHEPTGRIIANTSKDILRAKVGGALVVIP